MAAAGNSDELLALEGRMRAPDAIMETGMAEEVGRYIRAGGKPEEVIESLTTSYEAPVAAAGGASGSAFDAGGATGSSGAAGPRPDFAPDEFALLQELAKERFDPDQLLSVFRRGRPTWLHELTADARGRRLILDLSAEHRSSIFLNYAIRRIFDTGHDDEVAAVGCSLSSYFEVYHRLLARSLELAATAASTAQLARLSADLKEACAASQHTYAHAQHLLADLATRQGGGPFRRLSQELEAAAAERHGGAKVWAMQPLFVARDAPAAQREAVRLVSRTLVLGAGGAAAGGAALTQVSQLLVQLQELYSRQDPGERPNLEPLRHPRLLHLLLEGLFSWQQPPSPAVQQTAAQLLALAATGEQGAAAREARRHLETARALASRAVAGEKLSGEDFALAEAASRALTLAGLGLLHAAQGALACEATYDDTRCTTSLPNLLGLLQRVAAAQPRQAPAVVTALQRGLTAMGARRTELAESVIKAMVELLVGGHAADVLAAAEAWAAGADPSLIRIFATCVLKRAGPPYSGDFARPVLRLMMAGKTAAMMKTGNIAIGEVGRLREFAIECLDAVDFVPSLSDQESDLLEKLAAA